MKWFIPVSFRRAFTPIALTIFIALTGIVGSLSATYYITEKTEKNLTDHIVSAYIKNAQKTLRAMVLDNAWWNSAFLHITYRYNSEWIDQAFGTSDLLSQTIHGIAILKNNGTLLHQYTREDDGQYAISQAFFSDKFDRLKDLVLAAPEDRPEPIFFNRMVGNSPTLFVISPVTHFQKETKPDFPADKRDFLLFWYILTPEELTQKGDDMGIKDLHATKTPQENSLLLNSFDGAAISYLSWELTATQSSYLSTSLLISLMMFGLLVIGGYISFIRITELIDETEDAKAAAEKGHQIKTNFLATMSHELRTPLNSIIGFSDILRSNVNGQLNKIQSEYLDYIQKSGTHLLNIINEILDLSKIEAGKYELYETEIDLRRVIQDALIFISSAASNKNITITKDFPAETYEFMADEKVIKQLLLNLLSNAVKFTPENGQITIGYKLTPHKSLEIFVADNGIGISKEKLAIITEPYLQDQDHKTRSHEGTGLGLTISKAFIELHQGEMTIDSIQKQGTKVTLIFPPERLLD